MPIIDKIAADKAELLLKDRFTFSDSNDFRKRLFTIFDANVKSLSINLADLNFMDSAGLGMLMVALKECQQRDISLTLAHPRDGVKQMLELTKSYERFSILN